LHTYTQLDRAVEAFVAIAKEFGLTNT
jgi:hypothetical protein